MKKIYKLAPTLLAVILLTACDSFAITVKEPSFASKGKNIDQDTFGYEIVKAYNNCEYFKDEYDLDSKVVEFKETLIEKQNRAKNKTIYFNDEHTTQKEGVIRYDSEDLLLSQEVINREIREVKGEETNSRKTGKANDDFFYQVGTDEYANKVLAIDEARKEFEVVKQLGSEESGKPVFDEIIASQFVTYFNESKMMHFAEASDVHLYKFYKNNNMFTVTYKEKYETSEQGIINDHSVDVKKYYVSRETKSQVDFSESSQAIRISDKVDTTCEILQDHLGYKKGEIIDIQTIRYVVYTVAHRLVNLSRVTIDGSYELK